VSGFLLRIFEHPAFLWVTIAVVIPLVIEWLLRRRRRRIRFAAMRFLLDTERPKKIRMQDRILLILRMIIIFLLVLALARPLLRPEDIIAVDRSDRRVVMVFDATYSNAQRLGNSTSFGTAQRMANDVVLGLPDGVEVAVASVGQSLRVVQDWSADKGMLREKIDGMKVSHGAGAIRDGLAWALEKAREKGAAGVVRTEVYVFSDLQATTWTKGEEEGKGGSSARGLVPQLAERAHVFIGNTGGKQGVNLYVERFEPVDKILSVGSTTEFVTDIKVTGLAKGRSIPSRLTLYVNDDKRDSIQEQIPAEGKTVRLPYKVLSAGEQIVRVVADGDESPLDNERLFLARVAEAMKVLVLDDEGAQPAFRRLSVYWEYAIAPPSAPGREPVSVFKAKTCTWDDAQRENFGEYGAVVVANMQQMPAGLVSRLLFYVKEGGCLLTFAGEKAEPYAYEALYDKGNGPLPTPFRDRQEASGYLKSLLPDSGKLDAGDFRFFRALAPAGTPAAAPATVAQLSGGQPIVVSRRFGEGQSVLLALDPGLSWSRLPLVVDFPVFVQELLRSALGDPNRLVNLTVGSAFSQPVLITTQQILAKTPDGRKIRVTPEDVQGEELPRVVFSDTDVQGIYELEAPAGVLARNRFVVNLNPVEGDMAMWSESDFKRQTAGRVVFLSPHENITQRVESMYAFREFAGLLLIAVFMMMLTESFLAMRFGLRKG
jgi:hypothetical protein